MSVNPPRPKGPPLNALRAFEAALRHGSFAQAADELCVTPGAISQHIRALEEWLGAPLFRRRAQGVVPTALATAIAPDLTGAFDQLGQTVQQMRARAGQTTVHIAALPSIAQLWLSPRLPAIRAAHPDLRLSVSALETPPNLARDVFDLSVFLRPAHDIGIVLEEDEIFPVCAPHLADGISTPDDLCGLPLLHDARWASDWPLWARSVLGHEVGFDAGARYSLYAIALEEARNGAGVLMGHGSLVQQALARGELAAPLTQRVKTRQALVLELARPGPSPAVRQVVEALNPDCATPLKGNG